MREFISPLHCAFWKQCVWIWVLAFFLSGCLPHLAFRRTLSSMGYAWFKDLQRTRRVYRRIQKKTKRIRLQMRRIEHDRWKRAVRASLRALLNSARKHSFSNRETVHALLTWTHRLQRLSIRTNEPYARVALIAQVTALSNRDTRWHAMLERWATSDSSALVRKSAYLELFRISPDAERSYHLFTQAVRDVDADLRQAAVASLIGHMFLAPLKKRPRFFRWVQACLRVRRPPIQAQKYRWTGQKEGVLRLKRMHIRCLRLLPHFSRMSPKIVWNLLSQIRASRPEWSLQIQEIHSRIRALRLLKHPHKRP